MEQRHITGKSHWYHETQSSTAEYDVLPLVPEAAKVSDPFLLDVILDEETLAPFLSWLKRRTKNAKAFHDKCENFSFRASNETAVLITAFYSLHGDHLGYG